MAVGLVQGLISGALAGQKEGSHDAGNAFALSDLDKARLTGTLDRSMNGLANYQDDPTKQVMGNAITGQTFGAGGTLANTTALENQQANQGFALTPEDKTAYGQAAGNVARQFGQHEQSLSQALSDRGLSNSGVAGAEFSGLQGNRNEQLAGLQTQIAQKRMEMNQSMLANTRSFLSNLIGQGQNAITGEQNRGMQRTNQGNDVLKDQASMAMGRLGMFQNQQNEGLSQQQQTEHSSRASDMFQEGTKGAENAYKIASSYFGGGMAGGGGMGGGMSGGGGGG